MVSTHEEEQATGVTLKSVTVALYDATGVKINRSNCCLGTMAVYLYRNINLMLLIAHLQLRTNQRYQTKN